MTGLDQTDPADAGPDDAGPDDAGPDDAGETVVGSRRRSPNPSAEDVGSDDVGETVVGSRRRPPNPSAEDVDPAHPASPDQVMSREQDDSGDTVLSSRHHLFSDPGADDHPGADEAPGAGDHAGAGDAAVGTGVRAPVPADDIDDTDRTRVAGRRAPSQAPTVSSRARRTRIVLPAGTRASSRAAVGVGPGAVAPYRPRQIPAPPPAHAPTATAPGASRDAASVVPSVVRRSRSASVAALAAAAVACAITVAGLVVVIPLLFR